MNLLFPRPAGPLGRGFLRGWATTLATVLACGALASPTLGAAEPLPPSAKAAALDSQIDWKKASLLAVQDMGRYKTLDSFAREHMVAMTGSAHLPGLSPLASLFEWLFNRDAYLDERVIRVKEVGLQIHFTAHLPADQRERIRSTGRMTPREFSDPVVRQRIDELEPQREMVSAIRRMRNADAVVSFLDRMLNIVPTPGAAADAAWHTPVDLLANLPADLLSAAGGSLQQLRANVGNLQPIPEINQQQAVNVLVQWAGLRAAWLAGDAPEVQKKLDTLGDLLPTFAAAGVYPALSQRQAEALYYRFDKFTYGWIAYLLGTIIGVWALVTGWRTPWIASILLLVAGMTWHAFGIALRWYILDRIPVANMFEAIVSSAWVGIALALIVELIYRTRVFLVGAHVTGFMALIIAGFVLPGGGTITTIMGILDDVMLRIHTVLIIASYALIFLASVIAVIYLFGYYLVTAPRASTTSGILVALVGASLWLVEDMLWKAPGGNAVATGLIQHGIAGRFFLALGFVLLVGVPALRAWRVPGPIYVLTGALVTLCGAMGVGHHGFVMGLALTMVAGGILWAAATGLGRLRSRSAAMQSVDAPRGVAFATVLGAVPTIEPSMSERPILAGGAPGDERSVRVLPAWLNHFDWSHLIILNMVFVMLFVGIILGAVWADYSWGRPWGWDPKEVFALNTWIIYAILIHTRFVVRERGLWTAWLSVAGCLMMVFNWCVVNFFIVGLHSYA